MENGIFSGLDWFPTLVAAAGNPNITQQLLQGVQLGDRTYKNHLDGYNQMDLLTGKGPSARHELFYFAEANLGALRIDDFKYQFIQQPYGWPGEKVTTNMPTIVNLRQDPFERTPSVRGESLNDQGAGYVNDFLAREFWRFVEVQQRVAALAQTAVEFPPMQAPASFNLAAVKAKNRRNDEEPRRTITVDAWRARPGAPAIAQSQIRPVAFSGQRPLGGGKWNPQTAHPASAVAGNVYVL